MNSLIKLGKFYFYYTKYQMWGKVAQKFTNLFFHTYPEDAVENISQQIISETIQNISRYATKKAHTCRIRYENIGKGFDSDGRGTE